MIFIKPEISIFTNPVITAKFKASNNDIIKATQTAPFHAPSFGTHFLPKPKKVNTTDIGNKIIKIGPDILSRLLTPRQEIIKIAIVIIKEACL